LEEKTIYHLFWINLRFLYSKLYVALAHYIHASISSQAFCSSHMLVCFSFSTQLQTWLFFFYDCIIKTWRSLIKNILTNIHLLQQKVTIQLQSIKPQFTYTSVYVLLLYKLYFFTYFSKYVLEFNIHTLFYVLKFNIRTLLQSTYIKFLTRVAYFSSEGQYLIQGKVICGPA
jgi:hypothetical protein